MYLVKKTVKNKLDATIGYILGIGGIAGFMASFILTVEKIELIKDPSFQPSCNINPIISCGSVMNTSQAEVFGFPNSLIGIVGFTAVAVAGFGILAGARYKRWFWLLLQVGLLFAVGFVHWLFFQTVYRIGALCPYCMVVWAAVIPLFWYSLLYNLRHKNLRLPKLLQPIDTFAQKHHADILFVWFLILIGLILNHFWYYWETLI